MKCGRLAHRHHFPAASQFDNDARERHLLVDGWVRGFIFPWSRKRTQVRADGHEHGDKATSAGLRGEAAIPGASQPGRAAYRSLLSLPLTRRIHNGSRAVLRSRPDCGGSAVQAQVEVGLDRHHSPLGY